MIRRRKLVFREAGKVGSDLHIKSLKVFCDVVSRRSFSRAARENGISQSGASQLVNQLEKSLGLKLIDRSKRPFVLTSEGETYYDGCRKIVQRYYALEEEVRTPQREVAGRVSVASIYSVGLSHMNRTLQRFLSAYPKANVHLEYQHPKRVYELVESDQVDLGIVSYPRQSRAIVADGWREEPMVLACAPGHPLAGEKSIPLQRLAGERMIGYDRGLPVRKEIDKALNNARVEVTVAMEFDNIETIKRAVEISASVSVLPLPTLQREVETGSLVAVPFDGQPLIRPLGVIRRRGRVLARTAKRFSQILKEQVGGSFEIESGEECRPAAAGESAGQTPEMSDVKPILEESVAH